MRLCPPSPASLMRVWPQGAPTAPHSWGSLLRLLNIRMGLRCQADAGQRDRWREGELCREEVAGPEGAWLASIGLLGRQAWHCLPQ